MPNYIYALHCPIANTVRYIGKSINPEKRFKAHLSAAKTHAYRHHTSAWIRKLLANNLHPVLEILQQVDESERWQDAEIRWISYGKRQGWDLTNSTSGGEGLDYICPIAAAAYKANLSAAMSELWNRPERREEARQRALKGWNDPAQRQSRIENMISLHGTEEYRANWIRAMEVSRQLPQTRARMSAAAKMNYDGSGLQRCVKSKEFKAEQGKRLAKRWEDPEARDKLSKSRWSDEAKEAQAAEILQRKEKMKASITPEVLARRNAAIKASWDRRKTEKLKALSQSAT